MDVVLGSEGGHLVDDALGGEGVEAAFVEDHVGAVVAGVGASDAAGVGELADAGDALVGVEVDHVVGGERQVVELLDLAVGVVGADDAGLPGDSGDAFEGAVVLDGVCELADGPFALAADDYIDVFFGEGFVGEQGGMPASEDDGKFGQNRLGCLCNFNGAADHGAGEDRDAEAEGAGELIEDTLPVVGLDGGVDDDGLKVLLAQHRCQRQETQRRTEGVTLVRGVKEDDFPSHRYAPLSHERCTVAVFAAQHFGEPCFCFERYSKQGSANVMAMS